MKITAMAVAALGAVTMAGTADAATYVVPGTSNPFLAGAPSGASVTMNGYTDDAATSSPIAIAVSAGQTLSFLATGGVSNCPGCAISGPGGAGATTSYSVTANGFTPIVNGFSNLPLNALIGVFNNNGTANDPFVIGSSYNIVVPTGATMLYLGTVDSYQWANNIGGFAVDVAAAVPEPATWALMILGFGAIGATMRRRRVAETKVRFA